MREKESAHIIPQGKQSEGREEGELAKKVCKMFAPNIHDGGKLSDEDHRRRRCCTGKAEGSYRRQRALGHEKKKGGPGIPCTSKLNIERTAVNGIDSESFAAAVAVCGC